ncbi:hypothetical protein LMG32289_00283 [Cupriavidus pampae]|uniref:Uncharacterized protein n=2 Tax=Cupriavidus pampae TaxID=659251 RepID=A0ABM8W9R7_9BURK|nr:hypothetical protein LMG32289_00283 [Cupriavidus pampae]
MQGRPSESTGPPASMPRQYSPVFPRLVDADDDVVGMVAYTLYKRQKLEWIQAFRATHDGAEPTDREIAERFAAFSGMPSQIEQYRKQAVGMLEAFLQIAETAQPNGQRWKAASARGRSFRHRVVESIVANLVTVLLTAGVTGIAWVLVTGPTHLLRQTIEQILGGG